MQTRSFSSSSNTLAKVVKQKPFVFKKKPTRDIDRRSERPKREQDQHVHSFSPSGGDRSRTSNNPPDHRRMRSGSRNEVENREASAQDNSQTRANGPSTPWGLKPRELRNTLPSSSSFIPTTGRLASAFSDLFSQTVTERTLPTTTPSGSSSSSSPWSRSTEQSDSDTVDPLYPHSRFRNKPSTYPFFNTSTQLSTPSRTHPRLIGEGINGGSGDSLSGSLEGQDRWKNERPGSQVDMRSGLNGVSQGGGRSYAGVRPEREGGRLSERYQSVPRDVQASSSSSPPTDTVPPRPSHWSPTKKVSLPAMEAIKSLHKLNPERYTIPALSKEFEISYEGVSRILRSKFRKSEARKRKAAAAVVGGEEEGGLKGI